MRINKIYICVDVRPSWGFYNAFCDQIIYFNCSSNYVSIETYLGKMYRSLRNVQIVDKCTVCSILPLLPLSGTLVPLIQGILNYNLVKFTPLPLSPQFNVEQC